MSLSHGIDYIDPVILPTFKHIHASPLSHSLHAAMGQYWEIFNIDRQESLRNTSGLKLFEMLANGHPKQLIALLQVPRLRCWKFSETKLVEAKAR